MPCADMPCSQHSTNRCFYLGPFQWTSLHTHHVGTIPYAPKMPDLQRCPLAIRHRSVLCHRPEASVDIFRPKSWRVLSRDDLGKPPSDSRNHVYHCDWPNMLRQSPRYKWPRSSYQCCLSGRTENSPESPTYQVQSRQSWSKRRQVPRNPRDIFLV